MLADSVNGHEIRMLKLRHRLGFSAKAPHIQNAGKLAGKHHFDGNDTVQRLMPRLEDNAHAATPDFFEQFVLAKISTGQNR